MEVQKGKKEMNVIVPNEIIAHFSDSVYLEMKNDAVFLNFTQSLPRPPEGVAPEEKTQAKLLSRVVLTIPHFIRFAEICSDLSQKAEKKEKGDSE